MELLTERLRLVPCSLELVEALDHDRERAEALVDASIRQDWPDPELAEFLPLYGWKLAEDPAGRRATDRRALRTRQRPVDPRPREARDAGDGREWDDTRVGARRLNKTAPSTVIPRE